MKNLECTYLKKKKNIYPRNCYDIWFLHIRIFEKSMIIFNLSASTKQGRSYFFVPSCFVFIFCFLFSFCLLVSYSVSFSHYVLFSFSVSFSNSVSLFPLLFTCFFSVSFSHFVSLFPLIVSKMLVWQTM